MLASNDGLHETGLFGFGNSCFSFSGETVAGQPTGPGVLSLSDGSSIDGEFVNGEVHGNGTKCWADGSIYYGEFCRGEMHGVGRHVCIDGTEYEGEFRFGVRCGKGRLVDRAKKICYEGEFNKTFHGVGVLKPLCPLPSAMNCGMSSAASSSLTSPSDELELSPATASSIDWSKSSLKHITRGEFVNGVANGNIQRLYANGDLYDGMCEENLPHGKGSFVCCSRKRTPGENDPDTNGQHGITYTGPLERGMRKELPTHLDVTEIIYGQNEQNIANHLNTGDRFITIAQHTSITVVINLMKRNVKKEIVEVKPGSAKKKGVSKLVETEEMMQFSMESGRDITYSLFAIPQGLPLEEMKKPENLATENKAYMADASVSSRALQLAARRPSLSATPPPPVPVAPQPAKGKKGKAPPPKPAPSAAAAAAAAEELAIQRKAKFLDSVPHFSATTEQLQDGSLSIKVNIVSLDPGDFLLHVVANDNFSLEPGVTGSTAKIEGLECFVPIHTVRQC